MRLPRLDTISSAWFLTLGLTSLAAGILVYILLLESALGAFSIREASPARIGTYEPPRVALLDSDHTRRLQAESAPADSSEAWLDRTLLSWREYLLSQEPGIPFRDIDDEDLETGDLSEFDVLVLPSTRALSDRQVDRILAFMEGGGSVLASWATGVYREDGTWRGWSFVEKTFGVDFEGFAGRDELNWQVSTDTFPGTTPAGVYVPVGSKTGADEDVGGAPASERPLAPDSVREHARTAARHARFAPLSGYVWQDSLQAPAPRTDHVRARPVRAAVRDVDGERRVRDAVIMTWYTWVGVQPDARVPYPRTGSGIRRFTLRGDTPLTAGIPSGYRMKIQVYNPGVKVSIREPDRAHSAGFWFDFATDDLIAADRVHRSSGLVYGRYGAGRFVYMGFQRDAMGVGPEDSEDQRALGHFFRNSFNYLRRLPTIWVHDWPADHSAAAMITSIARTPGEVAAFEAVDRILRSEGIAGTWFVHPDAATSRTALLERLHARGDVGVTLTAGAGADGTLVEMEDQLIRARERLETVVNAPVTGYRPARRGAVSERTMAALVGAEYEYFMPDSIGRVASPRIMGDGFGSLVRIGTTTYAPSDHARVLNGVSERVVQDLLRSDIARVRYEGGLYNLVLESGTFTGGVELDSAAADMIREVARTVKAGHFWVAPGDEMALWWRLHRNIDVNVEARSRSRLYVRVSNNNGHTAQDVRVSVDLGRRVASVNIRPELINVFRPIPDDRDRPPWSLSEDGSILRLSIRRLKPQQYRIFHIDLLGGDPGGVTASTVAASAGGA